MRNHISDAVRILGKVYTEGAYSNMAFYGGDVSDMTTRLVYGTLEKNVRLDYILSSLLDKKPKENIYILLKVGAYALLNLDNVPDYAIVSECVEAAKAAGKGGLAGFVNAVLKKVARREFRLPAKGDPDYSAVAYSKPRWFIDRLVAEYGEERAADILQAPAYDLEHIRVNLRLSSLEAVKGALSARAIEFEPSAVGGLSVRSTPEVRRMFDEGLVTFQSPSSILAADALAPEDGKDILDLCSAPGGKAVYMSEKCRHSSIVACDVHPHRIALIQKYKHRMHAPNVKPVLADATVFRPEWAQKFDFILLDAPCSCFGTYRKHPDVFLQRGDEDIRALAAIQRGIAVNAARYLKRGGALVYSTCTLFHEENEDVADYLLSLGLAAQKMPIPFANDGRLKLLPKEEWDGFFIARFVKP